MGHPLSSNFTNAASSAWERDNKLDRKAVIEWGIKMLQGITVSPVDDNAIPNTVGVHELYRLLKEELAKTETDIFLLNNAPRRINETKGPSPASAKTLEDITRDLERRGLMPNSASKMNA